MGIAPEWIAVDWGTSNLRAWAMRDDMAVAEVRSQAGMGGLARDEFEPTLVRLISDWEVQDRALVLICGMAGARQGWIEAPYHAVPCEPLGLCPVAAPGQAFNAHILPGLRQTTPSDVMRGEETQIAGYLTRYPRWDGVICLPGTHTKWVQVSAGEVISFQTFMTGELFALLAEHSVLRHSVDPSGWEDTAFDSSVEDTLSKPERLAARLFAIRADHLLDGTHPSVGAARLSGLLLGAELAAARPYWLGTQIVIIGSKTASDAYARALLTQGATAQQVDAAEMTQAGLAAARRRLKETL
ncbi:MAG: 2-dehydro-3-deoxygalactonokinase [Pseudomonadota bacterium]